MLLSNVDSLSIILHLFLVTLNYPVEMMDFFGLLFPIITFDPFYEISLLYEKIFHFSKITDDRSLTDQFDSAGYSSIFLINNLGSLFIIIVLKMVLTGQLWALRRFRLCATIKKVQLKIDNMAGELLYRGSIDFFSVNFLILSVVAFIESNDLRFGNSYSVTEKVCSLFSIWGITFTFAFPSILFYIYWVHLKKVNPKVQNTEKIKRLLTAYRGNIAEKLAYVKKLLRHHSLLLELLEGKDYKQFLETYGN